MENNEIFENPQSFHEHLATISEEAPAPEPVIDEPQEVEQVEVEQSEPEQEEDDSGIIEAVNGQVPVSVLKRQTAKRREAENLLLQRETELNNIKRALEIYGQQEQQQREPEPEQSSDYDPIDSEADRRYKAEIAALKADIAALKGMTTATKQEAEANAFKNDVARQYSEVIKEKPDLDRAYDHILKAEYKKQLRLTGDKTEAEKKTNYNMAVLVNDLHKAGKNVAKEIYEMATEFGYSPKASGVNIDAIEKNIKKTSGVGAMQGASASPTSSNPMNYFTPQNIKNLQSRNGGSIDPVKFQAILDGITKNALR